MSGAVESGPLDLVRGSSNMPDEIIRNRFMTTSRQLGVMAQKTYFCPGCGGIAEVTSDEIIAVEETDPQAGRPAILMLRLTLECPPGGPQCGLISGGGDFNITTR